MQLKATRSLLTRQVSLLNLYAQVDFLNRLEAKVNKSNKPPNNSPHYKEVLHKEPAIHLHIPHLHIPNLRCGCPHQVVSERLCQELRHSDSLHVQDHTVTEETSCEGLTRNDWVEL